MKEEKLRELDAFIAEHVMGFKWARDCAKFRSDSPRGSQFKQGTRALIEKLELERGKRQDWNGWGKSKGNEPLAPNWRFNIPHYTTDPAAAMMVLAKCLEHGITILDSQVSPNIPRFTVCASSKPEKYRAVADTLPLAVCRFAEQLFKKPL